MPLNYLIAALCKPEVASGAIECILRLIFSPEVRKHCMALAAIGCLCFGKLRRLRIGLAPELPLRPSKFRQKQHRVSRLRIPKKRRLGVRYRV